MVVREALQQELPSGVFGAGHWQSNLGPAIEYKAVEDLYVGSWAMLEVIDDHKAVAEFLADKIIEHIESKQR